MKQLPFPLRVAAGLAVTTAERVRDLPKHLTELPVTVASQVVQTSMRVQQHVTELAIRGDDALAALRPAEDTPSWATFDEDLEPADLDLDLDLEHDAAPGRSTHGNGHRPDAMAAPDTRRDDPWAEEELELAREHPDGEFDIPEPRHSLKVVRDDVPPEPEAAPEAEAEDAPAPATPGAAPAGLDNYDELTLPQLRARLRRFSLAEVEELLEHERAHANRASFVGMLSRRAANVRKTSDTTDATDGGPDDPAER